MSAFGDLMADLAPEQLVPGDLDAITAAADEAQGIADRLADVGRSLQYIELDWHGKAARSFDATFGLQPDRFKSAARAFDDAAGALRAHRRAMDDARHQAQVARERFRKAQREAATAPVPALPGLSEMMGQGPGQAAAVELLEDARSSAERSADRTASVLVAASHTAPQPTLLHDVPDGGGGLLPALGDLVNNVALGPWHLVDGYGKTLQGSFLGLGALSTNVDPRLKPGMTRDANALINEGNAEAMQGGLDTLSLLTIGEGGGSLTLGARAWLLRQLGREGLEQSERAAVEIGPTTTHGAERIAGATATRGGVLDVRRILLVRGSGQLLTQADGASVRILKNEVGRFDVVIDGDRGLITTFSNLSEKSLDRLAARYGWD